MFWRNLLSRIIGFGKNLLAFIVPIVARHGAQLLEEALPIALAIVESYEARPTDGEMKREMAVAELKRALVAQGRATATELSTSLLNWIIETALQRLRAGK
jgi:hypothetical protein